MEFWLHGLIFLVAASVHGFLGFGFGILTMAGLAFTRDVAHAAAVVNLASVALSAQMIAALRRDTDWRLVWRMYPGLVLGIVLGLFLLTAVDARLLRQAFGASVVAIALWQLSPRSSGRYRRWLDVPVSGASGVLSGLFNTGGPVLVAHLYRQERTADTLKGTVQALFIAGGLTRLAGAGASGMLTPAVWLDFAATLAFVIAGTALGVVLTRRLPTERFRTVSWCALAVLGVGIAWLS